MVNKTYRVVKGGRGAPSTGVIRFTMGLFDLEFKFQKHTLLSVFSEDTPPKHASTFCFSEASLYKSKGGETTVPTSSGFRLVASSVGQKKKSRHWLCETSLEVARRHVTHNGTRTSRSCQSLLL